MNSGEQDPDETVIQVVMLDVMREPFERWLAARDLYLYRMPISDDDDLPTYCIGIGANP